MNDSLNDRQRRFAERVVQGRPAGRAYEEAGFSMRGDAADSAAARLIRKPAVADYLAELRAEGSARAAMTRDQAIDQLIRIVQSKPQDAALDNPLCELRMGKDGPYGIFPDKSRCLARLAKMLGWDEPEKHQLELEIVIGGNAESHDQD